MNHSFNVGIAVKYGMLEAVILEHLNFWIAKNRANEVNFYDGSYWTYSSTKALAELFPYASQKTISRALHHLKDGGLVLFGNYNKSAYDRTMWYALTDKGNSILQNGTFDLSKSQMESPEMENQSAENVQPIPDISTDIRTDKSTDNITVSDDTVRRTDVRRVLDAWNSLSSCGIRPVSKIANGSKRYASLTARIREYGIDAVLEAIEKVRESKFLQGKSGSKRQWIITFDWFVLPSNFPKVLEGNYADKETDRGRDMPARLEPDPFGGGEDRIRGGAATLCRRDPESPGEEEDFLPEDDEEGWMDFSAMSDEEFDEFLKEKLGKNV